MATMLLVPHHPPLSSPNSLFSLHPLLRLSPLRTSTTTSTTTTRTVRPLSVSSASSSSSALQALIFDCDGVILESEHLHRQAYNDAFSHFNVRCPSSPSSSYQPLNWDSHFYDDLQNRIGGGKPKMRWYFKEHGWPSSTISETPPEDDADRAMLIDTLQDWKTERYKEIIRSGTVEPRPGVLRLMDEAKDAGKKLAVCSAATKSSVVLCLENLIGIATSWQLLRRKGDSLEWVQTCTLHQLYLVITRTSLLRLYQLMNSSRKLMVLLVSFLYEIVKILQGREHTCGMAGDGVNDAPALKKADIGIAVADATDAARSASDIVLTEPGLSVIISAILTSRAIFQRMKNYTIYAVSITIRIVLGFLLLSAFWRFNFPPFMVLVIAILNDDLREIDSNEMTDLISNQKI